MSSNSVGQQNIAQIVGYTLQKGNFQTVTPNLPQRIAVFGEANDANQSALDLTPTQYNTAQQVGAAYGYGSPLYNMARILLPKQGGGVNGIPVIFYPQSQALSSTAKIYTITPVGIATASGTHYVKIGGRRNVDGQFYAVNIVLGDSISTINNKITDAVNNVLGCPATATDTLYVTTVTSKWSGKTANELDVTIDTNGNSLGITYTVTSTQTGVGTPDISTALNLFGNAWNTIVVSGYSTETSIMDALELFNGIPDPISPTGRYQGIIMKPFIALVGSTLDDPSSITDTRLANCTIAICPAPNSKGLSMEAAANMGVLFANTSQNTPNLDVSSNPYPDMPAPTTIGSMAVYANRDAFVKKGCSTVDLINNVYVVQDFVTTYHPVGETPPQFRYPRILMIDFNVRFGYYVLEQQNVIGHSIANDVDIVNAVNVIKPKAWKAVLIDYATQLVNRGLIVDATFTSGTIVVNISVSNPDRFETTFSYKRSGFVRIASTTATVGFNFGTVS